MSRFEFRLSDLGEGIHEAEVLEWKVKPGDLVRAFDPLGQVESAKAAVELTSPVAGRVVETRVPVGQTARVGDVLVVLEVDAEADLSTPPSRGGEGVEELPAPLASSASDASDGIATSRTRVDSAERDASAGPTVLSEQPEAEWFGIVGAPPRPITAAPRASRGENTVRAAPLVRKIARDRGIRLDEVRGSGPEGRVRLADLEAHMNRSAQRGAALAPGVASRAPSSPAQATRSESPNVERATAIGSSNAAHQTSQPRSAPTAATLTPIIFRGEERVPLQGIRKRVAEHMVEAARHAPQVTAMDLFDAAELVRAREQLRPSAEREGIKLTYLPFLVKAAVEALRAVPFANAVLDEDANAIVVKRDYNIGIATAVPGGLVVPIVKGVDRLSILEIAREIARLVDAARARHSGPADLQGGTFTISSFGSLPGGPLFATPILNYPEVAILGVGRIEEQPRVVAGQVVPRPCLGISFTFDHRVLDGEGAGQFMAVLRRYLEQPLELLLRLR